MKRRLHIEKRVLRNPMAFLLLLFTFLCPIALTAQDQSQLDTLKSQRLFLEIQLDPTIAMSDTTGFFKKIAHVFNFKENRSKKEKERFNKFIKEKIDALTIKIDSLSKVQGKVEIDKGKQETKRDLFGAIIDKDNEIVAAKTAPLLDTLQNTKEAQLKRFYEFFEENIEIFNKKFDSINNAQDKVKITDPSKVEIAQATIKLDPLKIKEDSAKLMKRIFRVFKFKSNRDRTERERVQKIIEAMMVKNDPKDGPKLRVDSVIIAGLADQFLAINKRIDSLKNDSLSKERAIAAHVNFLKRNLDTVNNALEVNYEEDKKKLKILTDSLYSVLREVSYSCKDKDFETNVAWDTISITPDSLVRIKKGIAQKIKVMGWHDIEQEDRSEDYQFNFLSSINYFGFQLRKDGKIINRHSVSTSNVPTVIERAKAHGCDVYLTIYNNDEEEIANFLESNVAQDTLFTGLEPLLKKELFDGINIYFEALPTNCNAQFKGFVKKLGEKLKGYDDPFELIITIPSIIDDGSLRKSTAYDFDALKDVTDYYLILTNNMINSQKGVPQSLSPLYKKSNDITGTIQSTIEFYGDKIKIEKLFMILPYSGVEWQVNYNGDLAKGTIGKELKYGEILQRLDSLRNLGSITVEGFNPKEVSAYVVFSEEGQSRNSKFKEIWYDDSYSLYHKYKWALKQGLGGVAIRDLGYDDGAQRYGDQYLDLWKTLAAATSSIDSCRIDSIVKISQSPLTLGDYWRCFWSDADWAKLNELGDDNHDWSYQWTEDEQARHENVATWEQKVQAREKGEKRFFRRLIKFDSLYFQRDKILYIQEAEFENDPELQTDEQYFYLLLRWRVYARILLICFFVLAVLGLILRFQRNWYIRYPPEKKIRVKILTILQPVFIFLTLLCLLGYLFFDPWVDIGGDLNQWIARSTFFILLGLGILFGIYITPYLRSQDLVRKNMP